MFTLKFLKSFMIKILFSKLKEKPQSTEDIFNKPKQCNSKKKKKTKNWQRVEATHRIRKPNG